MLIELSTGITVKYNVDGQGPPLLLLGGPHTCEMMRWFVGGPLTRAGFSLITTEYRGLPPSDVPPTPYTVEQLAADAASLLERLGVTPCLAIGYSLGAFVMQELALRRPELISRMVLAGTRTEPGIVYRCMHDEVLNRLTAGSSIPVASQALLRALMMFAPRRLSNDAFMETVFTLMHHDPVPGYSELGLTQASAHYRVDLGRLTEVRTPCLVIGFEDDVLTPPWQGRLVAKTIPHATYREMRRAGHGAFVERPQELVRLAAGFLRGATAPGEDRPPRPVPVG